MALPTSVNTIYLPGMAIKSQDMTEVQEQIVSIKNSKRVAVNMESRTAPSGWSFLSPAMVLTEAGVAGINARFMLPVHEGMILTGASMRALTSSATSLIQLDLAYLDDDTSTKTTVATTTTTAAAVQQLWPTSTVSHTADVVNNRYIIDLTTVGAGPTNRIVYSLWWHYRWA